MINLVELCAEDEGQELSPCQHGNIVVGHACYCHHANGPRKCPQWRNAEPYEGCRMFEKAQVDLPSSNPTIAKTVDPSEDNYL